MEKLTSCVKEHAGVPTLFINDEPYYGSAYVTYLPENGCSGSFEKIGVHLYSACVYFSNQTINPLSNVPIPHLPGIFDIPGEADFSVPDALLTQIVEADPKAMIFPRVNIAPARWWEEANPDELNDEPAKPIFPARRVSFSSQKWQAYAAECLRIFCEHYENSRFQQHLVGYQLACGMTQEWFSFDWNGGQSRRLREGFATWDQPKDDPGAIYRYSSEVTVDVIAFFAKKVKEYTNHRVVVGAFHGYTLETYAKRFAHCAVSRMLKCPDVDFLCSPMAYTDARRPGVDHAPMPLIDSLKIHGKLYFTECDERTYLSKYPGDSGLNVEPGTYRVPVWLGPDAETSRHVMRSDFARNLVHNNYFWWFDMWGGWYEHEPFLQDIQAEQDILNQALKLENRNFQAQVAVLMDEKSLTWLDDITTIASNSRIPLGSAGAPYDIYEMEDYETIREKYHVYVVIEPAETHRSKQVREDLSARGDKLFVINDNEVTAEKLLRFYRESGVHIYCHDMKVIHVNNHYLSIHNGPEAAETTIYLPEVKTVTPLLDAGETLTGDRLTVSLKPFETKLFRLSER